MLPYLLSFRYFNSRPHGGRQGGTPPCPVILSISTPAHTDGVCISRRFCHSLPIATHARREGDYFALLQSFLVFHFNSRPHGGRPIFWTINPGSPLFQLTPSRRATCLDCFFHDLIYISTHALTEGDLKGSCPCSSARYFNSRPHGGRHLQIMLCNERINFNSRPHGGRPAVTSAKSSVAKYFNSRPHGGRQSNFRVIDRRTNFNSRPHGGRLPFDFSVSTCFFVFQLTPSRRATANLDKFFF